MTVVWRRVVIAPKSGARHLGPAFPPTAPLSRCPVQLRCPGEPGRQAGACICAMPGEFDDADDLFSPLHDVEQQAIDKGHQDGVRDGHVAGIMEGRELGMQKGYEIGSEVGFYKGCVQMWRLLQARDPSIIPERAAKGLASLEELLASFPLDNPQDEQLQEVLEKVQGRFKAVASIMGCLQDYFPKEKEPAAGSKAQPATASALDF